MIFTSNWQLLVFSMCAMVVVLLAAALLFGILLWSCGKTGVTFPATSNDNREFNQHLKEE